MPDTGRDTAGQERYQSLAPLYYRGSHAAAVVYDVTIRESFVKAQFWIDELQRNAGPSIGVFWRRGGKQQLLLQLALAGCASGAEGLQPMQVPLVHRRARQRAVEASALAGPMLACTPRPKHRMQLLAQLHARPACRQGPEPGRPPPLHAFRLPAVLVLVGNKTDLAEQRQVSEEEGRDLADRWGAAGGEAG